MSSVSLIDRSLALNPNSGLAHGFGGFTRIFAGEDRAAISHLERALRLSPVDRLTFLFWTGLAFAYCKLGEDHAAIEWASKAVRDAPRFTGSYFPLVSSLAHLGQVDQARALVKRLLEFSPRERVSDTARHHRPTPGRDRLDEGARIAGLPE